MMMKIPAVPRSRIEDACRLFDKKLRYVNDLDWEKRANQKHGLVFNGQFYPPKRIVAFATGLHVNEFSGGPQTNGYLRALGFEVVRLADVITKPIPQFRIGQVYSRRNDIHALYGGNGQSGISTSNVSDAIFLFTGETGKQYGYSDESRIDADGREVYSYTGEGQSGDMDFSAGNGAILHHSENGKALHLFKSLGKGNGYRYLGEFIYVGHRIASGLDKNKASRKVIVFELLSVEHAASIEESINSDAAEPPNADTLEEARQKAIAAANGAVPGSGAGTSARTIYSRSKAVKDYVMLRANGICESCRKEAPFKRRNGTPYLEPHHTTRVSDGGPDHPRYVGAICPSCHTEIHHGQDGKALNDRLRAYLAQIEGND